MNRAYIQYHQKYLNAKINTFFTIAVHEKPILGNYTRELRSATLLSLTGPTSNNYHAESISDRNLLFVAIFIICNVINFIFES